MYEFDLLTIAYWVNLYYTDYLKYLAMVDETMCDIVADMIE